MTKRYYCSGFKTDTHNECCRRHDNAYGDRGLVHHVDNAGRPVLFTRAQADKALRECAIAAGLHPMVAWPLWTGLRLVGWAWWTRRKTGTPIDSTNDTA